MLEPVAATASVLLVWGFLLSGWRFLRHPTVAYLEAATLFAVAATGTLAPMVSPDLRLQMVATVSLLAVPGILSVAAQPLAKTRFVTAWLPAALGAIAAGVYILLPVTQLPRDPIAFGLAAVAAITVGIIMAVHAARIRGVAASRVRFAAYASFALAIGLLPSVHAAFGPLTPFAGVLWLLNALLLLGALAPPRPLLRLWEAAAVQRAVEVLAAHAGEGDPETMMRHLKASVAEATGTSRSGAYWLDARGPDSAVQTVRDLMRGGPMRLRAGEVPEGLRIVTPGSHSHGVLLAPVDDIAFLWAVPDRTAGSPEDTLAVMGHLGAQANSLLSQAQTLASSREELATTKELEGFKSQFLGSVAHELGNPLSPIRLQLHLLKAGIDDTQKRERAVKTIHRNVERLSLLVDNMKEVSRMQEAKLELSLAEADVAEIVRDACHAYEEDAAAGNCTIEMRVETAKAMVDAHKIGQVMDNILSNAIKYSPSGGIIHVLVEPEHRQVLVAVRDEGLGLTAEQREKVFDAYQRVHTGHGNIPGTGLGLAIVKGIVEAHGGEIMVHSEGEGKGTTFSFRLPTQA